MSFSILADEGLNGNIVRLLRSSGFAVKWVLEEHSGISDKEVIILAKNEHRLLITEDKDFGEWVFSHQIQGRFPGCEHLPDNKSKETCAQKKILEFVYSNLRYPRKARSEGIEAEFKLPLKFKLQ